MDANRHQRLPSRKDDRLIIHFDYDCFYASVFEAENPTLKSLPLAVQQKHIIVTCNYEARRRGLYKLQLITEAKRLCPEVVIVLGEDISRFRDASKDLYNFLEKFSWSNRVERLGFDEVWLDMTDCVDYNLDLLNFNSLEQSFFQTSKDDPTSGFAFDASTFAGHVYPKGQVVDGLAKDLAMRLRLGSHLAMYIRHQLEDTKGYTATVGISTNKLLSKLVGNLNKPRGQTTLLPPYIGSDDSNVINFIDGHDLGKIPGIGFKMAQKLREHILQRPADFAFGLVEGGTKEKVTVRDVRLQPELNPERLEKILSGPGAPHGIGFKIWCLLHGIDDTEVGVARLVPRQISIEDSYIRLDTLPEVIRELTALSRSLLNRMRVDLLMNDDDEGPPQDTNEKNVMSSQKRWLAHPKTIRLSTRPKAPLNSDGSRTRTFKRISHSSSLPQFVFKMVDSIPSLAEKLVQECLLSMFRRLHPEKQGWNLSLINIAVTNMAEAAGDTKTAKGRNISNMFKRQEDVLKDFRVVDSEEDAIEDEALTAYSKDRHFEPWADDYESGGEELDVEGDVGGAEVCGVCGAQMPTFALGAHARFHDLGSEES
ncbi:hypothetical protein MBLNU457_g2524t1 [Dothideomycetes sp. NU457]